MATPRSPVQKAEEWLAAVGGSARSGSVGDENSGLIAGSASSQPARSRRAAPAPARGRTPSPPSQRARPGGMPTPGATRRTGSAVLSPER